MNSEKVKEIKKALEDNSSYKYYDKLGYIDGYKCKTISFADILTLINELESENERLDKSDNSKEESSIEYYNLYKDLKRKNKDLNELCELQRVSISENFVKENQLKDRIAELEKENNYLTQECQNLNGQLMNKTRETATTEWKLKQFAERLKEKCEWNRKQYCCSATVSANDIDETLKEFINE